MNDVVSSTFILFHFWLEPVRDYQNKLTHGWYYGNELARADLSVLEIDGRPLKEKKAADGRRKLIYVKFKGYDDSFNRWLDKAEHGN